MTTLARFVVGLLWVVVLILLWVFLSNIGATPSILLGG